MSAAGGRDIAELQREETEQKEPHQQVAGQGVAPGEHYGGEWEHGEAALKEQNESGRPGDHTSPHPSLSAWDTRASSPPSYRPPTTSTPLLSPPDFKPFFTLIASPSSENEFLHPDVHYVFSDDDEGNGTLTSVALEAIERQEQDGRDEGGMGMRRAEEERVVVVDLGGDGRTVQQTTSLSGTWQGLRAEVAAAPSWGGSSQQGDRSGGLMLQVSGRERGMEERGETRGGDLEALLEKFGKQLEGLDEVLGEDVEEVVDEGEGGGSGRMGG